MLLSFRLDGVKIHIIKKMPFFLPTCNKFAIQNNPIMQLRLIFCKTLIKTNRKPVSRRGQVHFVLAIVFPCTHKFPT